MMGDHVEGFIRGLIEQTREGKLDWKPFSSFKNRRDILEELENLEYLWLTGSNSLPDLRFLKKMKKLKTFILDMNVLDGDLTPCLDIPYVTCIRDRRHYNLKDSDLPKGKIYRPEKELELWR